MHAVINQLSDGGDQILQMSAPASVNDAHFTSLLSLFSELDVNPVDFIIILLEDNTYQSHPVARSTLDDMLMKTGKTGNGRQTEHWQKRVSV